MATFQFTPLKEIAKSENANNAFTLCHFHGSFFVSSNPLLFAINTSHFFIIYDPCTEAPPPTHSDVI